MEMVALDCHKHYSVASVQSPERHRLAEYRIEHRRGNIRAFLAPYSQGCPVAIETIGNWYWIVDETKQAGKVPRVHASGGKTHYGRTRPDVNHYLKWAYTEAANAVAVHRDSLAHRHVGQLYRRIRDRRVMPRPSGRWLDI